MQPTCGPDAPGPCYAFDSQTYERETVWEEPGGTMAMVPLPGKNGDFLAVQRFFPGFQAQVFTRETRKGIEGIDPAGKVFRFQHGTEFSPRHYSKAPKYPTFND